MLLLSIFLLLNTSNSIALGDIVEGVNVTVDTFVHLPERIRSLRAGEEILISKEQ